MTREGGSVYTLIPGQDLLSWFLRLAPLWARTTQRGLFRVPETYTGRFGETLNDPPSTNKLSLASYHGRLAYVGVCMSSIRFLSLGVSVSVGDRDDFGKGLKLFLARINSK